MIVSQIDKLAPVRTDIHKGIKSLWEDGYMDSPRAKYKKAKSMADEKMDEEMGIRQHNAELFEELLGSPLLHTFFVIPEEKQSSISGFSVDPSAGYIALTSYSDRRGDTDALISEILRRNQ